MHTRLIKVLLLIGVAAIASRSTAAEDVPWGPPPLLNGLIGTSEWESATQIETGWNEGVIRIRSDSTYIYFCVASVDTVHTGLDLYIDNMGGEVFMLHVSSAHGQRFLSDTLWQEMTWGSAGTWTSNLIQMIFQDGRNVFLAPEAFEFQINRHLLPRDTFKFMIHLKRPERWVPDNPDTLSSDDWLRYGFDRPGGE